MRILIVDDEILIAQGIQYIIQKMDKSLYTVEVAYSGEEALTKLEGTAYDLLISDINMPGISGLELIDQVKNRKLCNYYCILSGYSDFEYARTAIRLGVTDYLLKPVNKDELQNILIHFLELDKVNSKNKLLSLKNQICDCLYNNIPMEFTSELFSVDIYIAVFGDFNCKDFGGEVIALRNKLEKAEVYQLIIPMKKYPVYIVIGKETQLKLFLDEIYCEGSKTSIGYSVGRACNRDTLFRIFSGALEAALYAGLLLCVPVLDYRQLKPLDNNNIEEFIKAIYIQYMKEISVDKVILYQFWHFNLLREIKGLTESDSCNNEYVKKMKKIIKENYQKEYTLNDVAGMINLNSDYLGRVFKTEENMSFQEYLNQYRMMRIIDIILQNPELSFEQVVPDMGFTNMRSFYRVFKKIMQLTPGEYREKILEISKYFKK